jgi:hypothetical protein
LHAFKDKYRPVWESRYLIYPGPALLLKTVMAIIRADSTEGLLAFLLKRRKDQPRRAGGRQKQHSARENGEASDAARIPGEGLRSA